MKKNTGVLISILIMCLFIRCSDESGENLYNDLQGKWKLVEYFTDNINLDENGNVIRLLVEDGYELELKNNRTFLSNEMEGYSGGTYSIIRQPGKNLKLEYKNGSKKIIKYKCIISTNENYMNVFFSNTIPLNEEGIFFEGEILARIP